MAAIERFKPIDKRRWIRDAGAQSLYLVIQPSGHRSWVMRFRRPDGKPGKIALGPVDLSGRELTGDPQIGQPLSLVAARHLAAQVHRERALGHNPVADHKARRQRQRVELKERADTAFGTLVRRFTEEHARNKRRWRRAARMLGLDYPLDGGDPVPLKGGLAQRWADKPVRAIDGHDLHAVLAEAKQTTVPGIEPRLNKASEARARDLFAVISAMFGWLHRQRLIEVNPCASVFRPPRAKPRDRTLSPAEIRSFWHACDTIPSAYAAAARVLLLTGCRLNEIAQARREEISGDGLTLVIPGHRTKNARTHVVTLAPLSRKILASLPSDGAHVFSINGGVSGLTGWSRVKDKLDAAMSSVPAWRFHDLRRSCVTWMVELGIAPHVVEAAINHISGSRAGVAGTYNRSELLPERRQALERWARFVALVVNAELHGAHEKFLAGGGDKARSVFNDAIAEGGERWERYLKLLASGGDANVVNLPRGRR
jgi:integrase